MITPYLSDPTSYRSHMTNEITLEEPTELLVATFGRARLVQTPARRFELRGGTLADLIDAREWASLFMPEITISKK
jgi:hypothetical protein